MDYGSSEKVNPYKPDEPLSLEDIADLPNIAERLPDDYLQRLGHACFQDYKRDEESRYEWEKRYEQAMKLALQVVEKKTYPWVGAASVKFPLITIAALQYHARAYPSLVNPNDVVRYQVFGEDPQGQKNALGKLLAKHMNWQLTEQDEQWEEGTDKALMVQPILGCVFKKTYYNPMLRRPVSELVFPGDLIVDYYTKSLESAARISHVIPLSRNEVYERMQAELFLECDLGQEVASQSESTQQSVIDKRQGISEPGPNDFDRPYKCIEQHRNLDLDCDGYAEPYIVTFHRESQKILRIVARYSADDIEYRGATSRVVRINAQHFFTKIPFIPSPDGGFYDIGFGMLLAPLTESINTLINQLIDAGTLQNLGGGFLGRGFKIKSGMTMFTPGEWKRADFSGDDIAKAVLPLPVPVPSEVLFKMLDFLVGYGERTGGAVDLNVGVTPGQNTPAETSRAAMESGLKVYNGIFKRTYRAFRDEFRKLYMLNRLFMPEIADNPFGVTFKHYMSDPKGIRPAADPNIMSDGQRLYQAEAIRTASREGPGWDLFKVQRRWAEAMKIVNIDELLPIDQKSGGPAIQPPPNPKMIAEQNKGQLVQVKAGELQWKIKSGTAKLMQEAEKTEAQIKELEAKAMKERAEAQGVQQGHQIALIDAELAISKEKHAAIRDSIRVLKEVGDSLHEQRTGAEGVGAGPGDAGAAGSPARTAGSGA